MIMPNMVPILIDIEDDEDERGPQGPGPQPGNPKQPPQGGPQQWPQQGKFNEVDRILNKIEKNNPEIFQLLRLYNMPYPVARRLVRRIIRLTLDYQK